MEGLIKGLIDVALGNDGREEERRGGEHGSESEHSRSTWAQVCGFSFWDLFWWVFEGEIGVVNGVCCRWCRGMIRRRKMIMGIHGGGR